MQAPALYKYIGAGTNPSGLAIADHFHKRICPTWCCPHFVRSHSQTDCNSLTVANEAGTFGMNGMCFCLKFDEFLVVSLNHANSLLGRSLVQC